MTNADTPALPKLPDPLALRRRISWLLAIVGAVFTPLGLALGVYLLFVVGIGLTLLAIAAFMVMPAAVLNLALRRMLRGDGAAPPDKALAISAWLWGIGLLVVAAAVTAGIVVVLAAGRDIRYEGDSLLSLAGAVLGMAAIGAVGAAGMIRAWSGFFGQRARAHPALRRTILYGAALLAMFTALLAPIPWLDSDLGSIGLVAFTALGGGTRMGLVGHSALRDLAGAAPGR